jgi:hypothetical protein
MNKDIKQLAEEMLDSISKVNGFSDFGGIVLDYDLHYTTIATLKDVITAAMVEMYTAGAREATNPEERIKQLKADLYLFRDMYCQNIDLSTIDEYVDGLATTTPLSSSSGEAPAIGQGMKWVKVEDGSPTKEGYYLICRKYGEGRKEIKTSFYRMDMKCFDDFLEHRITHWMPLPPMPNSTQNPEVSDTTKGDSSNAAK